MYIIYRTIDKIFIQELSGNKKFEFTQLKELIFTN